VRASLRATAGVLAALGLLLPALTAAADDDPSPADWPSIKKPTDGNSGQPDPEPIDWPEVVKPAIGAAEDPPPTDWPAPEQG
jgi:hypothetical protein